MHQWGMGGGRGCHKEKNVGLYFPGIICLSDLCVQVNAKHLYLLQGQCAGGLAICSWG